MTGMRALTVRQPWAAVIAAGHKTTENRSRGTAYRGPLAIHAGLTWSLEDNHDHRVRSALGEQVADEMLLTDDGMFAIGAVVAVAQLVDAHPADGGCCAPWGDPTYRGRRAYHLVLADVRPLADPVPCRGALGLWRPPADVLERIEAAT